MYGAAPSVRDQAEKAARIEAESKHESDMERVRAARARAKKLRQQVKRGQIKK